MYNIFYHVRFYKKVRLICNHSKHGGTKEFPVLTWAGTYFPVTFPIQFGTFVAIGDDEMDARPIITEIIEFFELLIIDYLDSVPSSESPQL